MKRLFYMVVIFLVSGTVLADSSLMNPKRWDPLGTRKGKVVFDQEESALHFTMDFIARKPCVMWPLITITEKDFPDRNISAVRLTIKFVPEEGTTLLKSAVLLPKNNGVSGEFQFVNPEPDTYETISVKLNRTGFALKNTFCCQIIFDSTGPFAFFLKNIEFLDAGGNVIR